LPRPDIAGYVIDPSYDYVDMVTQDGVRMTMKALQIWCDPKRPHAHRSPEMRDYIERKTRDGYVGLVRYSAKAGIVLLPPSLTGGDWVEKDGTNEPEHSAEEYFARFPATISEF
jgi:hypothetical protein